MQRFKKKKLIPLALGIFAPLTLTTPKVNASAFGAEIFCTMRDGGNDHESSWDAAYTYIKKQKGGLFKVSPKKKLFDFSILHRKFHQSYFLVLMFRRSVIEFKSLTLQAFEPNQL